MHDIYYGTALPPNRVPIPLVRPTTASASPFFRCDPDKIVAIVETLAPDRNLPFAPPDAWRMPLPRICWNSSAHEVAQFRLPAALLPLQSGVRNIANACSPACSD